MIIVFAAKSFYTSGALGYFSTSRLDIAPWLLFLQQKAFFYIWHSMLFLLNICLKLTPFCIVHSHFLCCVSIHDRKTSQTKINMCTNFSNGSTKSLIFRLWNKTCLSKSVQPFQVIHLLTVHCPLWKGATSEICLSPNVQCEIEGILTSNFNKILNLAYLNI